MATDYKPDGLRALTPYLHIENCDAFLAFLKAAFNAGQENVYRDDSNNVVHAEIRIDDSILEFSEARPEYPSMPSAFHLYVPAVDETYRRALKAGAASMAEPADQFYGERSGAVRDAWGNNWYIATYTGVMKEDPNAVKD
ncbi:VOC family protein [uncultured Chitinophaga sp.]|jgi:Uncharacterized protein conserved in bacteria|uniref:VOC family protein n=1 Tax=uncultured Chitinophaga sp. TaxID=339340 RepID=UPI00260FEF18|nr:VOC family protein [uncultured Chitinophaga sp.]